jgi:hypothetical protein
VSIIPRHGVDTATENRLRSFEQTIPKLTDEALIQIIRDTNKMMQIRTTIDDTNPNLCAFSNVALKIEICGPEQEQFTVVDVPGIFRVPSLPSITDDDVRLVRDMVESYMKNTRSIIFAVLPSNVDITTQEILKIAEKADCDGLRTIGLLTKPDLVTEKATQTAIKEMVLGRGKQLRLGYCVVKNRGADDQQSTVSDRRAQEEAFFGTPEWHEIAASGRCGIESLKSRLSDLLLNIWKEVYPIGKACFTPRTENISAGGLSRQIVSQLLGAHIYNPFHPLEEQRHPWSVNKSQELDCPLLRIWDRMSGSVPREDGRMMSRSLSHSLGTKLARVSSLASHLDHKNWVHTPYVSFKSSANAIEELASKRISRGNRGVQYLTVIDPATRFKNGLPVLDVIAEMEHYSIRDPYQQGDKYYHHSYVCLWEITKEEIVSHWEWDELARNENWYEEIIMPAFIKFREEKSSTTRTSTFDMSKVMQSLLGQCSVFTACMQLTVKLHRQQWWIRTSVSGDIGWVFSLV